MLKITRRNIFKLIVGAVVAPLAAITSTKEVIAEIDFGFTWGKINLSGDKTNLKFEEIIKTTLREKREYLVENLTKNNNLLLKLQDNQYIKINKIDPKEQEQ